MSRNEHNAIMSLGLALGYKGTMNGWCAGVSMKWIESSLINQGETFVKRINKISEDTSEYCFLDSLIKLSQDPTSTTIDEISQLVENEDALLQYQNQLFYFNREKKELTDVTHVKEAQAFQDNFSALAFDTVKKRLTFDNIDKKKADALDDYFFDHYIVEKINAVKLKAQTLEGRQSLTDDDKELLDILPFYDGLQLYMYPHLYNDILHPNDTQRDVEKISAFATSEAIETMGGIKSIYSESQISTVDEIESYLKELQTILDEHAEGVIGFRLQNYNHMIGANYNPKTKQWTLMDINHWPPITSDDTKEIATHLKQQFDAIIPDAVKKDFTAFNSNIIVPNQQATPQLISALNEFKKHNIENITPEIAKRQEGANLLWIAAWHGQTDIVIKLLQEGADPDSKNINGFSALISATYPGFITTVEALLEHHANPLITNDKTGDTPLHVASSRDQPDVFDTLIRFGAHIHPLNQEGNTPLMLAAKNNNMDIVKKIIAIDPNTDLNIQNTKGQTALYLAAAEGATHAVAYLLQNGANVNQESHDHTTILLAAVKAGHSDVVKLLLENGAAFAHPQDNPDVSHTVLQTAMQQALEYPNNKEYITILHSLLDTDVSLERIDAQIKTKLLIAATENGHFNIVKQLITKSSDININAKNNKGQTALYLAASHGDEDLLQLLIKKGADPNISSNEGITPLLAAVTSAQPNVVKTLLDNNTIFAYPRNDRDAKATKAIINTAIRYATAEPQNNNKITVLGTLLATGVNLKDHKNELNRALKMAIETKNAPLILELFQSPHLDIWKIPYKAKNAILEQLTMFPKDDSYRSQFAAEILENKNSKLHKFFHERARFSVGTINISAKPKETTGNLKEALILAKKQFQEQDKEKEDDREGEGPKINPNS